MTKEGKEVMREGKGVKMEGVQKEGRRRRVKGRTREQQSEGGRAGSANTHPRTDDVIRMKHLLPYASSKNATSKTDSCVIRIEAGLRNKYMTTK